jgi:soluble cytochrome b562
MLRKITVALLISTTFIAVTAHAQFTLKGIGGVWKAGSVMGQAAPDAAAQVALVRQFVAAQSTTLAAQASFAKAFGLAEQVQLLEDEKQSLSSGATDTAGIKKSVEVSESVQKAINEKIAAKPQMDVEAKKNYAEGLVLLVATALEAKQLGESATQFGVGLKSLNPMQAASAMVKLRAGAWVAKETPGYLNNMYGATKSALTFAKANNIPVPKNADALSF